jgi:hypothetical protein
MIFIVALFSSIGLACLAFLALKASMGGGSSQAEKQRTIRRRIMGWLALGASIVPWLVYADTVAIGVVTWSFCITPLAALAIVIGGAMQEARVKRSVEKRYDSRRQG